LKERNQFAEFLRDPNNQNDRQKKMEMMMRDNAQADYANTFEGRIKIVDYVAPVKEKERGLADDPSTSALSETEPIVSHKKLNATSFAGTDLKMSNEERLKAKHMVLTNF
jgi:hypothetical protein